MANSNHGINNSAPSFDYSEAEDLTQDPIAQAFDTWQISNVEFPGMSSSSNASMFQDYTPVSTPISLGSPALNISPGGYGSYYHSDIYVPNVSCVPPPQSRMLPSKVNQGPPQTIHGFAQLIQPPPYSYQSTDNSFPVPTQGEPSPVYYENSAHSGNGYQTVPSAYFVPSPPISRFPLRGNPVEAEHRERGLAQKNYPRKRVPREKIMDPRQLSKLQRGAKSSREFRRNENERIEGRVQIVKNLEQMLCAEGRMHINAVGAAFFNSYRLNVALLKSIDATDNGSRTKMKIATMKTRLTECTNSVSYLKNTVAQMVL
ncbi:hypothetical protein DdX_21230 [Ditylenchus destructor]|uniref:Uncharacterized protein n=1 Tax=Ditylenchus destructor TaxID=166010 RepID=A0AAD4QVW8_9BILA|nr:hypothetical protein DdX_21230 [Ditylenchus destructor]